MAGPVFLPIGVAMNQVAAPVHPPARMGEANPQYQENVFTFLTDVPPGELLYTIYDEPNRKHISTFEEDYLFWNEIAEAPSRWMWDSRYGGSFTSGPKWKPGHQGFAINSTDVHSHRGYQAGDQVFVVTWAPTEWITKEEEEVGRHPAPPVELSMLAWAYAANFGGSFRAWALGLGAFSGTPSAYSGAPWTPVFKGNAGQVEPNGSYYEYENEHVWEWWQGTYEPSKPGFGVPAYSATGKLPGQAISEATGLDNTYHYSVREILEEKAEIFPDNTLGEGPLKGGGFREDITERIKYRADAGSLIAECLDKSSTFGYPAWDQSKRVSALHVLDALFDLKQTVPINTGLPTYPGLYDLKIGFVVVAKTGTRLRRCGEGETTGAATTAPGFWIAPTGNPEEEANVAEPGEGELYIAGVKIGAKVPLSFTGLQAEENVEVRWLGRTIPKPGEGKPTEEEGYELYYPPEPVTTGNIGHIFPRTGANFNTLDYIITIRWSVYYPPDIEKEEREKAEKEAREEREKVEKEIAEEREKAEKEGKEEGEAAEKEPGEEKPLEETTKEKEEREKREKEEGEAGEGEGGGTGSTSVGEGTQSGRVDMGE